MEVVKEESRDNKVNRPLGILMLPISMMAPFGLFGFRPGQLGKHYFAFALILICSFNYILALVLAVRYTFFAVKDTNTFNVFESSAKWFGHC